MVEAGFDRGRGSAGRSHLAGRKGRAGRGHDLRRDGRPADETQFAEFGIGLSALEFWAKQAPIYLADEEIESASPSVRGKRLVVRYERSGWSG